MRILLAFVSIVALLIGGTGLADGRYGEAVGALAVFAVASVLLWRNLRNPNITRRMGLQAKVTFTAWPGEGLDGPGTFARVRAVTGVAWDVVLDRTPERGDFDRFEQDFAGWVWLGEDDLPARVKISYAQTWESRDVRAAARVQDIRPA